MADNIEIIEEITIILQSGVPGEKGDTGNVGSNGVTGPQGEAATITVGTVTTGEAGTDATVTNIGTSGAAVLDFSIPRGAAATITAGTTTTGAAGTSASVVNSGNESAAVLDFTIPGSPTITVGTTTTGEAGTAASVTNSGTESAAVLNFTIPRGVDGTDGSSSTDITGNAATATKLQTARTINGVSFDGTANITVTDSTKAPIAHSSSATTYGISTASVYGHAMASGATPLINGTASAGTDNGKFAREGHVHPTDTTRAALASPAFTGTPAAPTATSGTSTTQIATTAFVQDAITMGYDSAHLFSTNGYQKLSNGLIIQWGHVTDGASGNYTLTFPITFPSACFSIVLSLNMDVVIGNNVYESKVRTYTTTGATIAINGSGVFWIAIGN